MRLPFFHISISNIFFSGGKIEHINTVWWGSFQNGTIP